MKWTTKKPDREGWWWNRVLSIDGEMIARPMIIELSEWELDDLRNIGEWSSEPIPEPEE